VSSAARLPARLANAAAVQPCRIPELTLQSPASSCPSLPSGFGRQRANRALQLYYGQLFLNQIWTPIRFGFGQLGLAFIDLTALTTTLGFWLYETKDVSEKAFWLNVPYFLWSTYATYLSGAAWWLNGGETFVKTSIQKIVGGAKDKGKDL
jgi:hypothetical protein